MSERSRLFRVPNWPLMPEELGGEGLQPELHRWTVEAERWMSDVVRILDSTFAESSGAIGEHHPTHEDGGVDPLYHNLLPGKQGGQSGEYYHLTAAQVGGLHGRVHILATNAGLGADHTISGATAGHVLRASTADAAAFAQLQHADLGGVSADQHHAEAHNFLSTPHGDTTPAAVVRGDIFTGQGATPKVARLAKGTALQALLAGANEPGWVSLGAGHISGLTATRILFGAADGTIGQDAGLLYDASNDWLAVGQRVLIGSTSSLMGLLKDADGMHVAYDASNYLDFRSDLAYWMFAGAWAYSINATTFKPYNNLTQYCGDSGKYWLAAYSQYLYLNSGAYWSGATANEARLYIDGSLRARFATHSGGYAILSMGSPATTGDSYCIDYRDNGGGNILSMVFWNTGTLAGDSARFYLLSGSHTDADAFVLFRTASGIYSAFGIDGSDDDKLVYAASWTLGTTNRAWWDRSGHFWLYPNAVALGSADGEFVNDTTRLATLSRMGNMVGGFSRVIARQGVVKAGDRITAKAETTFDSSDDTPIQPEDWAVGKSIRLTAWGIHGFANGTPVDQATIRVYLGTLLLLTRTLEGEQYNARYAKWALQIVLRCTATGAGGTLEMDAEWKPAAYVGTNPEVTPTLNVVLDAALHTTEVYGAPISYALNAARTLHITVQRNAASALSGYSSMRHYLVEELP